MTDDEIRDVALRIAGEHLRNFEFLSVAEALDGESEEDVTDVYEQIQSIGSDLEDAADDPDVWEDEDGEPMTLTPKGFLALMLEDMVPGLTTDQSMELVTDLIERAVDRAVLDI